MKYIDLRSDTVTKPTHGMLEAMMRAEVGDDVFGEDPTVNKLQLQIAEMFGKESSLFVPSGTMGNEVCIKAHTQPGDEIIVEQGSHIFVYETGAPSLLSGVQMKTLAGEAGRLPIEEIKKAIRSSAYYLPRTALVCLENTHMRSGGSVVPLEYFEEVAEVVRHHNIKVHLDGARLWNACVASGMTPRKYADCVDSLSVCFSKGLGAPIGSVVAGSKDFIERCRKYRKIFGGGMRQVGILAAAALYAIEHHIDRLREDHEKARYFADRLSRCSRLAMNMADVQTNMVITDIEKTKKSQQEVLSLLKEKGVLLNPEGNSSIRAVMHLNVSMDDVQQAASVCESLFK